MADKQVQAMFKAINKSDVATLTRLLPTASDSKTIDADTLLAAVDGGGSSPLHRAAIVGCTQVVDLLLQRGASVNARDGKSKTPLHEAAAHGHLQVVRQLLDGGALLRCHKTNAWTPLMYAVRGGHTEVLQHLLAAGVDIEETNKEGASALYIAAREGKLACVQLLLAAGANPHVTTDTRRTPCLCATMNGHVDVLNALLTAGADVNVVDSSGTTVWHQAAEDNQTAVLRMLWDSGFVLDDSKCRNLVGRTPLHCAALSGNVDVVQALLAHGSDLEAADQAGCTALYYAASRGHLPVVSWLLSVGANPNHASVHRTPLHAAAIWDHSDCVRALLDAGARPLAVDDAGLTPLEAARQVHKHAAVAVLETTNTNTTAPESATTT